MANNANVPRGLIPYQHLNGASWNGVANIYYVPSGYGTALYIGDPIVTVHANNDANGIPCAALAASGTAYIGSVVGIVDGGPNAAAPITVTRDLPIYHPASTAQYILVTDSPNIVYLIQDDGSAQAAAANTWSGLNANLVSGSGSTYTGYSGWQLQASSVAVTNTLDLKILRTLNQTDNVIGTVANTNLYAKWLVKINNYQFANQEAGV